MIENVHSNVIMYCDAMIYNIATSLPIVVSQCTSLAMTLFIVML